MFDRVSNTIHIFLSWIQTNLMFEPWTPWFPIIWPLCQIEITLNPNKMFFVDRRCFYWNPLYKRCVFLSNGIPRFLREGGRMATGAQPLQPDLPSRSAADAGHFQWHHQRLWKGQGMATGRFPSEKKHGLKWRVFLRRFRRKNSCIMVLKIVVK